jgi:hypothetical protein
MRQASPSRKETAMSTELPKPLADYYAAKNRHDIDAMLAPFAEDAVVKDEGETHRGPDAIRAWMEETTRKYRVTVVPTVETIESDRWTVAGLVSGNFPGSPATLHYRFRLTGDRIAALEIGA